MHSQPARVQSAHPKFAVSNEELTGAWIASPSMFVARTGCAGKPRVSSTAQHQGYLQHVSARSQHCSS